MLTKFFLEIMFSNNFVKYMEEKWVKRTFIACNINELFTNSSFINSLAVSYVMTWFKQYDCLAYNRAILRLSSTYLCTLKYFLRYENEKDNDFDVLRILSFLTVSNGNKNIYMSTNFNYSSAYIIVSISSNLS